MYNKNKRKNSKLNSLTVLDNNAKVLEKVLGNFDAYKYSVEIGKYKKDYVRMSKTACELGADEKKLAELFDVQLATIKVWKDKYPEFNIAIVYATDKFNTSVLEQSLLKIAEGYELKEITTRPDKDGNIIEIIKTKTIPPNVEGLKFFLKNRDKDRWKDSTEVNKNINHNLDLTKLSTDELEKLIDIVESADTTDPKVIDVEVLERT